MDAHVAAVSAEHGLILYSTDRDFAMLTGIKRRKPLALHGDEEIVEHHARYGRAQRA
jgi:hypothetical protein